MNETVQSFINKANNGDIEAMEILGSCYLYGEGVEKDDIKAHKYFLMAAEKGSIPARYMVGMDYLTGEGVQKNISSAETYIKSAADAGYAKAQYILGLMYKQGEIGFFGTDKKAFKYFEKAAMQGLGKAQIELGDAYLMGIGVRENLSQGIFWLACAYLHGYLKDDAEIDIANEAVERLNSLIHSGVPGGQERIDAVIEEVRTRYPQYIKKCT